MSWTFLRNVVIKALLLFIVLNLIFAAFTPLPALGKFSLYNWLFPGRLRFPFGETPQRAYNLSLYNVEAMFASHVLAGSPPSAEEYRVFVIGDSSVWGTLLQNDETLSGILNDQQLRTCDGRPVRVYNLGYPTLSLAKDLMLLSEGMRFQPDLIIWLVTLESFPRENQLSTPLVANNPARVRSLVNTYQVDLDPQSPDLVERTFWQETIIGQRRALADWFRLQFYGVLWAGTGIDQYYPEDYEPAARDLEDDRTFHGWEPPELPQDELAFGLLEEGMRIADEIPLLVVNEPILISAGENSDIRYNFFYPRWAYDQYRQILSETSQTSGWTYLDTWDLVPQEEFTNSAIHLTPDGETLLADRIAGELDNYICLSESP